MLDTIKFKALCIQAYQVDSSVDLRQKADELRLPLRSLSTRLLNILVVLAYARRHVDLVQHLSTYPAPPRSTFDTFGPLFLSSRLGGSFLYGHSVDCPNIRVAEWKMWIALLRSDWIHYPLDESTSGLYVGITTLIDEMKDIPELRSSPYLEELCELMSKHDIVPSPHIVSRFLSITSAHIMAFPYGIQPCSLDQANMILSHFPVHRMIRGKPYSGASADLALPITYWGQDNRDRLVVMKMLLDQGIDPNESFHHGGMPPPAPTRDTALHRAAGLGDMQIVKLLLEHGANTALLGDRDQTPAEKARANGHDDIAAILESIQGFEGPS